MNASDAGRAYPIRLPGEGEGHRLPGPAERVAVAFEGPDAGVEQLTWGQWSIWEAMSRHGSWMPLGGSKPLEAGVSLRDVAEELRYLMTRYPSMRTRLRFDSGPEPAQELFGSGEIHLEVHDADDGTKPGALAAAVEAHYKHAPLDLAGDWPVRMAVIRRHGELTHMVAVMCHLVTDAAGARVMLREVAARTTAPPVGTQQLEQARWQRSAGRRHDDRALRYHEKLLTSIAPRRPSGSADPRTPRYWSAELRSRALRPAAQAVARRTGATASTVLLTLYAVALARVTGVHPVVVRPLVGNRFRPGLADVVCMLSQLGLCVLDVADATVDEAVARTQRAALSAYKYGYYDPRRLAALVDRIARERGPGFDISCVFNDRRDESPGDPAGDPAGDPLTGDRLRAARDGSEFRWAGTTDRPSERLFLTVEEEPEGIVLGFAADTHHFPPGRFETLLRDIEDLAVEAALDPAAPTGVTPSGRGA
ncbi:condensation domain-containing protein [Streptomyces sp. HPF1205]|uniref:condensation domain-containing protein n=1 Tax=Streptomyces sp. HPF1205 TaxID=2873262 RepID=UPI001CED1BE9|nr:condensation domain-containing protein [Streptomyces sp. HPF1205]